MFKWGIVLALLCFFTNFVVYSHNLSYVYGVVPQVGESRVDFYLGFDAENEENYEKGMSILLKSTDTFTLRAFVVSKDKGNAGFNFRYFLSDSFDLLGQFSDKSSRAFIKFYTDQSFNMLLGVGKQYFDFGDSRVYKIDYGVMGGLEWEPFPTVKFYVNFGKGGTKYYGLDFSAVYGLDIKLEYVKIDDYYDKDYLRFGFIFYFD